MSIISGDDDDDGGGGDDEDDDDDSKEIDAAMVVIIAVGARIATCAGVSRVDLELLRASAVVGILH